MAEMPKAPQTFEDFTKKFPGLAEAWEKTAIAGKDGPLDEKTARLVKNCAQRLWRFFAASIEPATHFIVDRRAPRPLRQRPQTLGRGKSQRPQCRARIGTY